MRLPSPAARAIRNNPAPTTTAPMARATRSQGGARRSRVMAAVTTAIVRGSMTPMMRRIAVKAAEQQLQRRPRRSRGRQAVPAFVTYGRSLVIPAAGQLFHLDRRQCDTQRKGGARKSASRSVAPNRRKSQPPATEGQRPRHAAPDGEDAASGPSANGTTGRRARIRRHYPKRVDCVGTQINLGSAIELMMRRHLVLLYALFMAWALVPSRKFIR